MLTKIQPLQTTKLKRSRKAAFGALQLQIMLLLLLLPALSSAMELPPPPTLNGAHLRFTVAQVDEGWVEIEEKPDYNGSDIAGRYNITGYSIDMIREVAKLANFTYDLLPPSGFGSLCTHPNEGEPIQPYSKEYWGQFLCGQCDVQEDFSSQNQSEYNTDLYQSIYYITPERLLLNRFTVPFIPPAVGNFQLYGTAIRVKDMDDYLRQQKEGLVGKVCLHDSTADTLFALKNFPTMEYTIVADGFSPDKVHAYLEQGDCDTFFGAWPQATQNIMLMKQRNLCKARNMPIGLVGAPLEYGYGHFAMGIRKELDHKVDRAMNYWMTYLMSCSIGEEEGQCPWNFATAYKTIGGETGTECGYVANPPGDLSASAAAGIAVAIFLILTAIVVVVYIILDKRRQDHRIRKRFVQQLARYIEIGNSPEDITSSKLSAMFEYISSENSNKFTEEDFLTFMMDIHLPFLSDKDLKQLWKELDSLTNNQLVSPVEFVLFLQTCQKEFGIVRQELRDMPKKERIKFSIRRLSSIELDGEEAVRRREYELNKSGRTALSSGRD